MTRRFSPKRPPALRELNERYRRAGERRALLPSASPARLERRRGKMDRLGTQARQAARTQSPAARRHRYDVSADRRPRAFAAVRHPLRHHARRRHAAADRRREAAGRKDGASAQPAALRSACRPRRARATRILQPRVTPSLPIGSEGSLFQRVFSGPNGLDPYAFAVSDVYQDLFEEGSYCGKGIYDVDVFEAALDGQIPENTVLSHDLLEGIFARAGLASDIEVVEEFPSRYDVAAARQHRWVRGDWQLLPWIFGRGRKARGGSRRTAIPLIGRWKLLDNLRRSLSAPAALLALLIGWLLPMPVAAIWTAFILLTIALPPLCSRRSPASCRAAPAFRCAIICAALARRFRAGLAAERIPDHLPRASGLADGRCGGAHAVPPVHSSPPPARMGYGRADQRRARSSIRAHSSRRSQRASPSPLFVAIADRIRRPSAPGRSRRRSQLCGCCRRSSRDGRACRRPRPAICRSRRPTRMALRLIARRTWRFFEKFVTAEDNMLPPDNFQEDPEAGRRAPDLADQYRSVSAVGCRRARFRLARHARCRGAARSHVRDDGANWSASAAISTIGTTRSDLRALEPKYISSVDSGNLAGHLIALGNACREIVAAPVVNPHWAAGLEDTLGAPARIRAPRTPTIARQTRRGEARCRASTHSPHRFSMHPSNPADIARRLTDLTQKADTLVESARDWPDQRSDAAAY